MEATYQKMQNDTLRAQGGDPEVRGLVSMMGPTLHYIDGYGCWCYFGDDHGHGRGQPVNEVDALCQWLHHGYTKLEKIKPTNSVLEFQIKIVDHKNFYWRKRRFFSR